MSASVISGRVTPYQLFEFLFDPAVTEDRLCRLHDLTLEQVAYARAYLLNNVEEVEARTGLTKETLQRYREWQERQQVEMAKDAGREPTPGDGQTFREWFAEQGWERPQALPEGTDPAGLIHDRGRGPELVGTRITVYNLFTDFLDATKTEDYLCRLYKLAPEQVAALRAYVFNNLEEVLSGHLRIEERIAREYRPEVNANRTRAAEMRSRYKEWQERCNTTPGDPPTFAEWLAEQRT